MRNKAFPHICVLLYVLWNNNCIRPHAYYQWQYQALMGTFSLQWWGEWPYWSPAMLAVRPRLSCRHQPALQSPWQQKRRLFLSFLSSWSQCPTFKSTYTCKTIKWLFKIICWSPCWCCWASRRWAKMINKYWFLFIWRLLNVRWHLWLTFIYHLLTLSELLILKCHHNKETLPTLHLLVGFIGEPAGQFQSVAYSGLLESGPITRNLPGGCKSSSIRRARVSCVVTSHQTLA